MKRVILIDDDATTNYLNKLIIEKSNLVDEVIVFDAAQEALGYLKDRSLPSENTLVFLDINMPVMDGWQFLDEYQAHINNRLKIIMLTSSINPIDEQAAEVNDEIIGFYSKPLSLEAFRGLIANHFN